MSSVGKCVLVVEDSAVMRGLFKLVFEGRKGIRVDNAGDGVAALQAVRSAGRPYDLIFLDLNMPIMDGMKFLAQLAHEPLGTGSVVAVVTTEASEEAESRARALGAGYFLRKPVTRKEVDAVIREVLG